MSMASASGLSGVTNTYVTGSGTETVPAGAHRCVATIQGGGAGGFLGGNLEEPTGYGGGAGGEAVKTFTVTGGQTMAYSVGFGSTANSLAPGGSSTVTGTVTGGTINMIAHGGAASNSGGSGAGGIASGGDTNLTGGSGTLAGAGGTAPYGDGHGNGGSDIFGGQGGIITFSYS